MVGKSRSGLANDRRGYRCARDCFTPTPMPMPMPIPKCSSITYINLADIATYNSVNKKWLLNKDTTITRCQELVMPIDPLNSVLLEINGFKLQNDGIISYEPYSGSNTNSVGFLISNFGSLINNNICLTGNTDFGIISNGKLINNGYFLNATYSYVETSGIVQNNNKFINSTRIDVYDGGTITNNGTFENNGEIRKADGSSTCGIGTINGTNGIVGNAIVISCP